MGRLPVIQKPVRGGEVGRDHNTYGFSMWLAGGGFKGGVAYGELLRCGHGPEPQVANERSQRNPHDHQQDEAAQEGLDHRPRIRELDHARRRALERDGGEHGRKGKAHGRCAEVQRLRVQT